MKKVTSGLKHSSSSSEELGDEEYLAEMNALVIDDSSNRCVRPGHNNNFDNNDQQSSGDPSSEVQLFEISTRHSAKLEHQQIQLVPLLPRSTSASFASARTTNLQFQQPFQHDDDDNTVLLSSPPLSTLAHGEIMTEVCADFIEAIVSLRVI